MTILYLLSGKKLKLHGGEGLSNRSFIHIDDVSNALYKIMTKGNLKNTYHISTDEFISIKSLVELICYKMEYKFEDHVDVVEDRLGKDTNYFLNSDKLKNQLNWKPFIDLNKGIEKCIIWVSNNLEILKKSLKFINIKFKDEKINMKKEIDLLKNYPKSKRDIKKDQLLKVTKLDL